jgi:REP element-mobilizing transposase RayT
MPSNQDFMRSILDTQRDLRGGRGGRQSKDGDRLPDSNRGWEPVDRPKYDLSYACLLIPRASQHSLNGKVAGFLEKTIQGMAKTFGWQLTFLQVKPEYLQWVVSAPPATPPTRCIRMIRDETSKGILAKFREFRVKDKKNGGNQDFWAPPYLLLVGTAPHPPEIIRQFIDMTRQQQGLPSR